MKAPTNSLDEQIAHLNIYMCEFIDRDHQCTNLSRAICAQLEEIINNSEVGFFPYQQSVYLKMLRFWKAKHLALKSRDEQLRAQTMSSTHAPSSRDTIH